LKHIHGKEPSSKGDGTFCFGLKKVDVLYAEEAPFSDLVAKY
jgi:hypothetical protein